MSGERKSWQLLYGIGGLMVIIGVLWAVARILDDIYRNWNLIESVVASKAWELLIASLYPELAPVLLIIVGLLLMMVALWDRFGVRR